MALSENELRVLAKCEVARRMATITTTREKVTTALAKLSYGDVPDKHAIISKLYALGYIEWVNGTHTTSSGRKIVEDALVERAKEQP